MHSFVTQCINFENSFTLITREVARVAWCYAAISYFGVTFSPAILRALNFNLICLLIKYTICEPKIWYCRIAQCHSGHLPGDLSEGIFKIDSLGHKRINKQFLKSSRRAYWTRSITIQSLSAGLSKLCLNSFRNYYLTANCISKVNYSINIRKSIFEVSL